MRHNQASPLLGQKELRQRRGLTCAVAVVPQPCLAHLLVLATVVLIIDTLLGVRIFDDLLTARTKKIVPVNRVSFWRGVLRDYLLRRRRMLKFLGKKRKRQLLRSLSSDPLSEGHPVYRDTVLCLNC